MDPLEISFEIHSITFKEFSQKLSRRGSSTLASLKASLLVCSNFQLAAESSQTLHGMLCDIAGQKKTFFVACGLGWPRFPRQSPVRNIANAGRCVIGFHRDPLLPGREAAAGTVDHIHYGRWLECWWWWWHEIPFQGTQPSLRGDDVGKFSTMAWSFFLSGEHKEE